MAIILSWFLFESSASSTEASLSRLVRGGAPRQVYILAAVFGSLQLLPLAFKGDHTLTGQGRIFALHMFEARQDCEVFVRIHQPDGSVTVRDLKLPQLPPRVVCDPVVYFNRAQNLCRGGLPHDAAVSRTAASSR